MPFSPGEAGTSVDRARETRAILIDEPGRDRAIGSTWRAAAAGATCTRASGQSRPRLFRSPKFVHRFQQIGEPVAVPAVPARDGRHLATSQAFGNPPGLRLLKARSFGLLQASLAPGCSTMVGGQPTPLIAATLASGTPCAGRRKWPRHGCLRTADRWGDPAGSEGTRPCRISWNGVSRSRKH